LFVGAGAVELAVAGGGVEVFRRVFGQDQGVRREERSVGWAAQEAEGLGVVVFGVVGWVEEDDVDGVGGLGEALEKGGRAAVFEGEASGDIEVRQVRLEGLQGGCGFFGEEGVGRATGDGFDADGAGSGEEIGEAAALDTGAEDVEEGLAEAVAGGASAGAGR